MSNADEVPSGSAAVAGQPRADVGDTGLDHALERFQQTALGDINSLFDQIDRDTLEGAVQALADARNVLVVGMHSAHSFASHLHHVASKRFRNWHLVEWRGSGPTRIGATLTDEDMVIGIATEPHATDIVEVARYARGAGARVVGIIDGPLSPLADCANDVLLFPIRRPSVLRSYVAATAFTEVLVGMVAARSGALDAARQA